MGRRCSATVPGYVAGFFFGADLITTPPFATRNAAEIFLLDRPRSLGYAQLHAFRDGCDAGWCR